MTATAAAFFDLDKTILATTASAAFARPFFTGGLISPIDALRASYAEVLYLLGSASADQTERLRAQTSTMVAGWPVDEVRRIATSSIDRAIRPMVYAEAVELIQRHHAAGLDVVIVSASPTELVEPIAAVLGADDVIATSMAVADGRYTGEIDFYAYGENKAEAIRERAAARGYDLSDSYAYSDSITDAPLLRVVGHAHAVNPDRALRALAAREGWGVLSFTRSASLRSALTSRYALVAGCALVGAAALAWAFRDRPRPTSPSTRPG